VDDAGIETGEDKVLLRVQMEWTGTSEGCSCSFRHEVIWMQLGQLFGKIFSQGGWSNIGRGAQGDWGT